MPPDTLTPPAGFKPISGPPPGWKPLTGPPPGWEEKPDRSSDRSSDLRSLTENPNKEGTYAMLGPAGESVPIPYSKVLSSGKTGYKLDPKDYSRFMSDFHFAHKSDKTPGPSPESEFETADTTEKAKRKGYGILHSIVDLLPTAGTIVGGITGIPGFLGGPTGLATAAAGAAAGAAIGEGARQVMDDLIWGETMSPMERAEHLGFEAAMGGASEVGGRYLGKLVGKAADWYGDTAKAAAKAGYRMLPSEVQRTAAGFLERYAKASMWSSSKMAAWRVAQNKETAAMANNLAESISGFSGTGFKGTKEDLGKIVRDGIEAFQKDFHAKQDALYTAIDQKTAGIKPDKKALVDFAQKELDEIEASQKAGGVAPTGKLKPMLEEITKGAEKVKTTATAAAKAKTTATAAKAAAVKAAADETAAKAAAQTAAQGADKAAAKAAKVAADKAAAKTAAAKAAATKAAADDTAAKAAAKAAAKDAEVSYQAMKNTRSGWLGLSRTMDRPLSNAEKGLVDKVAGLINQSMTDAARKSGIPGLVNEVAHANAYTRETHELFEKQLMKNIARVAGKEPSKIADMLNLPSTKVEGARALMTVLGPAEREAVQTHLIRDAISGATTEGKIAFDERAFAGKILKMDDAKGEVIFGPGNWSVIKEIATNMSYIGEAGSGRGGAAELSNPATVMKIIAMSAEGAGALAGLGGPFTGGVSAVPIISEAAAIKAFAKSLTNPKLAARILRGLKAVVRAGPYATQATINMAMGAAAANADQDTDTIGEAGEAPPPEAQPVPLPQVQAEAEQRNPTGAGGNLPAKQYVQVATSDATGHEIGTDDGVAWFDVETGKRVF